MIWRMVLALALGVYLALALVVSIRALGSWRDRIGPWGDFLLTFVTSLLWPIALWRHTVFMCRLRQEMRDDRNQE